MSESPSADTATITPADFLAKLFPNYDGILSLSKDGADADADGTTDDFHVIDMDAVNAFVAGAGDHDVIVVPHERAYGPAVLAFGFEPGAVIPQDVTDLGVVLQPQTDKDGPVLVIHVEGDKPEIDHLITALAAEYPELSPDVPLPGRSWTLEPSSQFRGRTVGQVLDVMLEGNANEARLSAERPLNDATVIGEISPDILNTKVQISVADRRDAKTFKVAPEVPFERVLNSDLSKIRVGKKDGKCFVPGVLMEGRRINPAVTKLCMMGLDVDSGASMDKTTALLQSMGLFFIAYTTHSHGSRKIEIKKDRYYKWAGDNGRPTDPTTEGVRGFLREEGKYVADVIDSAEYEDTTHETTGVMINVRTRAIDKFRLLFLLEKPFVIAEYLGPQKAAITAWGDMILGMGRELGIKVDRAARDPARLFYLSSRDKSAVNAKIIVNAGGGIKRSELASPSGRLDWTKIKPVSIQQHNATSSDPFDQAADAMGGSRKTSPLSPTKGLNLWDFERERGHGFQISQVFKDHCEDRLRGETAPGKFTCECPFDDEHSNAGDPEDPGCYVQDAGMDAATFAFRCSHTSCSDRSRADMMHKAMVDEWFSDDVLTDPAYDVAGVDDEDGDNATAEHQAAAVADKPITHFKKMEQAVTAMNNEIAIVQRGGDAVIYQKQGNGEGWLKLRAAKDIYAPWTAGKDKDSVFSAWLKSPARDHRTAVVFEPYRHGEPDATPRDQLNMYRGFAIEPVKGDWMDLQRHIFRIICNGDKRLFAYVMAWLADMVQNPGRKIGTALAILSVEGTGKSLFTDFVRQIWGNRHSVKVSDPRQLTGNFNGHMSGKMLAVAEEAFFAGDPKIDSIIKDMITSDRMMMENKFMDAIEVGDYRRFILLSNAENVVRATGDARSYAVTLASAEMKGKAAYFQKLADQLKGGKVSAAMLHDLLRLDIAAVERTYGIDLRNPPLTDALISQILINMRAEDRWLRAVLADGTFPDADGDSGLTEPDRKTWQEGSLTVAKEAVYRSYRSMVKARDGKEVSPEAISMFFIGAFRKQKGEESLIKVDGDGKTGRSFVLPSLLSLREFYAEKSKVPLDHRSVVEEGDLILPPKKADDPDYADALLAYKDAADTFINGVFDRK
ncbi:primase-helicase family protein [Mesorhizobium sp. M0678]|uniref:primase-helicase family protein n=1 Tax=Mesorhizobium sp. M0678 TaxID=2956985 RepID=UPI00333BC105